MDNGASSYRRFLDGDESAFDDIVTEYRESLTRFLDGYVHDCGAAEDIAIDVFTYVLVHKHKYNFKTSFKTYLFMLGRSRALDYIKHRGKIQNVEFSEAENELSEGSAPEEKIFADERREAVRKGMEKLPDDMREVLTLVYFEELSYEDAARVMKKNKKQIDNLLYRSKEELRSIIGKEGELLL